MQFSRRPAGFALFETLMALLLFAVALMAACATLGHSLRATHQAMLATRAVDLAADFVEELHAQPAQASLDALAASARERVNAVLPAPARDSALELIELAVTLRQPGAT